MPRLRIVELPMVHVGEASETPFAVILDQVPDGSPLLRDLARVNDAVRVWGARGALVTADTIDLADELLPTTLAPVELHSGFDDDPEWRARQLEGKLKEFAEASYREDLARMDAVTNALGLDRLRDWDEIVTALKAYRAAAEYVGRRDTATGGE
jgi:hypothetical protein